MLSQFIHMQMYIQSATLIEAWPGIGFTAASQQESKC